MINLVLTPAQRAIIITICGIEVEALTELMDEGPNDDTKLIIQQHEGVSEDDWYEELENMRSKFSEIINNPELLFQLEEGDLSIFRHILFNLEYADEKDEDCVTVKYPKAVKNLWRKLFISEDFTNIIGNTLAN